MSLKESDSKKDEIYSTPQNVGEFRFDAIVADVFENMINRSVPGYPLMLDMIGVLAERFAQPNTNCYDLGCSLGAATLKMRHHIPESCHLVGVDTSEAMVERCRNNIARDRSQPSVEIVQQSVQNTNINNASMVVLNFTLQFIPDEERQTILKRIADGLVPGGILILAEKVRLSDSVENEQMIDLHHEFKRAQGYSDLEIAQKRASLENVLVPNTVEEHIERLIDAGFETARLYVRCFNFVSILATKQP